MNPLIIKFLISNKRPAKVNNFSIKNFETGVFKYENQYFHG